MATTGRLVLLLATAIVLGAFLAGCLEGGEDISPSGSPSSGPSNETGGDPEPNATGNGSVDEGDPSSSDDAEEDSEPNGTESGTEETAANGTEESNGTSQPYDPGWPAIEDAEIRPGVGIAPPPQPVEVGQWGCTANFVFSTPDNRTLYLGTAAHCLSGLKSGDPVSIGGGIAQGTLVYSSFNTAERHGYEDEKRTYRNDFALVRIPEDARELVHPAVEHFGGPTGLAGPPAPEMKVMSYGNSSFREPDPRVRGLPPDTLDPREGYVAQKIPWLYYVRFNTSAVPADSGSPVIDHEGQAVGLVKTLAVGNSSLDRVPAENGVVSLLRAVQWAEDHTDLALELKTRPLVNQGQLPDQSPVPLRPPELPR